MALSGAIQFNDRDLGDFGFDIEREDGAFGVFGQEAVTTRILGASGLLTLAHDPRTKDRVITLRVFCRATSQAAALQAWRDLSDWLSLGPLQLRTIYAQDRVLLVAWEDAAMPFYAPQFIGGDLVGTLTFRCLSPFAWERVPRRYIAGSGKRCAIPVLSGPSQVSLFLTGATNPTVTQRDGVGNVLRTIPLTATLATADGLGMDTPSRKITRWTAGVQSDAPTALTVGYGFATIDPRTGTNTFEASSGVLWIDVRSSEIL